MANKLRAFISSTMEDLGNERRAVVAALNKMGVVPINAEALSTNGHSSWDVIRPEIENAQIFILILGDRYGWIPEVGYGAGSKLSITHLELKAAQNLGKPIFVFMKKLPYGAKADANRDGLRREISDWATGYFREEFEWADDLAEKVWRAFTNLWQDAVLRELVQRANKVVEPVPVSAPDGSLRLASSKGPQRVLLAGAGMSIAAGYPTASFLMRLMADDLWGPQTQSSELQSLNFSTLAQFYAVKLGPEALRRCIAKALDTPLSVSPTPAHMSAVRCFRTIVTTNYDELFEQACTNQGIPFRRISPLQITPVPTDSDVINIYKLVGSVSDASSMVITNDQLALTAATQTYRELFNLFSASELIVVGHGLRDSNVIELLEKRPKTLRGTYVSPAAPTAVEVLLNLYGLDLVTQSADEFMLQLEKKYLAA